MFCLSEVPFVTIIDIVWIIFWKDEIVEELLDTVRPSLKVKPLIKYKKIDGY